MTPPIASQRGIATALVLWLTSALMILVAAMSWTTRTQAQLVGLQSRDVTTQALGEAAANLALRDMLAPIKAGIPEDTLPAGPFARSYRLDETEIHVIASPANGLINLNNAGEELLAALFAWGAGLPEDEARSLAQRVIDWRDADHAPLPLGAEDADYLAAGRPEGARDGPFILPEDLRQVLGVTPAVFARIAPLTTTLGDSASVNPTQAPPDVLAILYQGNPDSVQAALAARQEGNQPPAWNGNLPAPDSSKASVMRIESWVTHPDGTHSRYARWVDTGTASPTGLPWLTMRLEPITHHKPPRKANE